MIRLVSNVAFAGTAALAMGMLTSSFAGAQTAVSVNPIAAVIKCNVQVELTAAKCEQGVLATLLDCSDNSTDADVTPDLQRGAGSCNGQAESSFKQCEITEAIQGAKCLALGLPSQQ